MKEFDPLVALAAMQEALSEWPQRELRRLTAMQRVLTRSAFWTILSSPRISGLDPMIEAVP